VEAILEQLQRRSFVGTGVGGHSESSVAVAWGQFGNPGKGTPAAGSWYQRTGEEKADWEEL
jgi:hypothetical protein